MKSTIANSIVMMMYLVFLVAMVSAWFTHVITCFIDGAWGFLVAGALMFPVAIVHGIWLWF